MYPGFLANSVKQSEKWLPAFFIEILV